MANRIWGLNIVPWCLHYKFTVAKVQKIPFQPFKKQLFAKKKSKMGDGAETACRRHFPGIQNHPACKNTCPA
jgi:hypothetical protein